MYPEADNQKDYTSFSERITLVTVGACGFLASVPEEGMDEDLNRELSGR
jgi:hypothetical protein